MSITNVEFLQDLISNKKNKEGLVAEEDVERISTKFAKRASREAFMEGNVQALASEFDDDDEQTYVQVFDDFWDDWIAK